jgi:hypothetical protein
MPYGFPIPFEGEYQKDENYPLYIVRLRCSFTLKKDHIPTIQLKNNNAFIQTEYLISSKGRIEELTLTNVDLELFLKHYKTQNLEYVNGYKFKSCEGIFNKYIDYWMEIKANNEGALRTLAKLMLNNLYGKFATNPLHQKKIPVYDPENDIVKYTLDEAQYLDPV